MDGMKTEPWDVWIDGAHDPALNMAADEALLLSAPWRGRPLLRFYEWDRPAVSIGYVQTIAAAPEGYAAVRRPTGGGVVYHDFDFTYTVMFPAGHWLCDVDRVASYDWNPISAEEKTSVIFSMRKSCTSGLARSRKRWLRPSLWGFPGIAIAQSGCAS